MKKGNLETDMHVGRMPYEDWSYTATANKPSEVRREAQTGTFLVVAEGA